MPTLRQSSFANGEIDPGLHGRHDLPLYANAVKSIFNAYPTAFGRVLNRAGTRFVGEAAGAGRLLPFTYSDNQAYVLELSDLKMRVWRQGQRVLAQAPQSIIALGASGAGDASATQGADWLTNITPPGDSIEVIVSRELRGDGDVLLAISAVGSTVYRSGDGGATWSVVLQSLGVDGATCGAYLGSSKWVVYGSGGAFRVSYDDGVTWTGPFQIYYGGVPWGSTILKAVADQATNYTWIYSYHSTYGNKVLRLSGGTSYSGIFSVLAVPAMTPWRGQGGGVLVAYTSTTQTQVKHFVSPGVEYNKGLISSLTAPVGIAQDEELTTTVIYSSARSYQLKDATTWTNQTGLSGVRRAICAQTDGAGFVVVGTNLAEYGGQGTWATATIGAGDYFAVKPGGSIGLAGPLELTTPWEFSDLSHVQISQSGDVVFMVCAGKTPQVLTRLSENLWELIPFVAGSRMEQPASAMTWVSGDTSSMPLRTWQWVYTAVNGDGDESLPSPVLSQSCHLDIASAEAVLNLTAIIGAVRYEIYRGRNGVFGWVGSTTGTAFGDDGIAPDYDYPPPAGNDPFPDGDSNRQPRALTFFADRLVFGSTQAEPAALWTSKRSHYYNFDAGIPPLDTDAIEFMLAARRYEEIRWMVGKQRLIIGTQSTIWSAGGAGGEAFTPYTREALVQSESGSSWLVPIVTRDSLLYVRQSGNVVRELAWDDNQQQFAGTDLSIFAKHLFEGRSVVDWAIAEEPHSTCWIELDDGSLLSLTYMKEQKVVGWAHHGVARAKVLSVCGSPEGAEDTVYLLVEREIDGSTVYYIEAFTSRTLARLESGAADARSGIFLDSALSRDGRNTGATTVTVSGASYAVGASVTITASASLFASSNVGDHLVLRPNGEPVRLAISAYSSPTSVTATVLEVTVPVAYRATASTDWALAVDVLTGLEHLEGEAVSALADGEPVAGLVVSGGQVTLPSPAAWVHVGLPYVSEVETLDPPGDATRGLVKTVSRVAVELEDSRGIEVGQAGGALARWSGTPVTGSFAPVPLLEGRMELLVSGRWSKTGGVLIRQDQPLPMSLVAVEAEVAFGGR